MQDGILLINKPIGMTSRDVVNILNKKFNTKKIGHTGTLDPFASGLLILTINKGTKISNYIEAYEKEYLAEITLGSATTTYDIEGEVVFQKEVNLPLDKKQIENVLKKYLGDIDQIPPMYSAIKVNGTPLYKLARNNQEIERKPRRIHIEKIDLCSVNKNRIIIDVVCSKGTYIRSLGNDIGEDLGYGGHLSLLTRTRVGNFLLKNAKSLEEVTLDDIISIKDALSSYPSIMVNDELKKKVLNGVSLKINANDEILIKDNLGNPLAFYKLENDGKHHCVRGLW